jgi:hypothetical protein
MVNTVVLQLCVCVFVCVCLLLRGSGLPYRAGACVVTKVLQLCYSDDKVVNTVVLQLCVCVFVCVCVSAVEELWAAIQSGSLCCYRNLTVVLQWCYSGTTVA